MTALRFFPMPTDQAERYRRGAPDAHGMAPERHISSGSGVPCRHCLEEVAAGAPYLVLAYCPFEAPQPYAEVGPIFLHAEPCPAYDGNGETPALYLNGEPRILRGYGHDDRILYGSGRVVLPQEIGDYAAELLEDPAVKFLHLRSSTNNCYACRIERVEG